MTLTDNGECAQKLVFAVTFRRYGIILQIRLDTDDIVRTLVAYNSSSGNIHHFDVFRHDNVRGHFPVDVYLLVSRQMYGYACDKAYYQKNSGFHILLLYFDDDIKIYIEKLYLSCILRVYQINDGIVLDFRLVLSDIGRYGRSCRVIHVLQ